MRILATAPAVMIVLSACSQSAPPAGTEASSASTEVVAVATAASTQEARFNPTAAVGGGINATQAISPDDLKAALGSVPQFEQLRITANSSPPGAKGADVASVSVVAQDGSGVLKSLDQAAKKSMAEALLTAASNAWPKASVTLLVTDPAGASGLIIGTRGPGGPSMVIVS